MAKYNFIQNSFSNGELSGKIFGRTDLKEYFDGCEQLENNIPYRLGGASRRPGTRFVTDETAMGEAAYIPFSVEGGTGFVIAINPRAGVPPGVTSHPDIAILDPLNLGPLTPLGLLRVELQADLVSLTLPFIAPFGTNAYHYAQSADTLVVTHRRGLMPPLYFKLERDSSNAATGKVLVTTIRDTGTGFEATFDLPSGGGAEFRKVLRVPFRDSNIDVTKTLAPSATTGAGITVTASVATFTADHVDTFWKITEGTNTGVFKITGFTNSTTVTADVMVNFASTLPQDNWQEPAWSDERLWPKTVTFFESRLIFGGSPFQVENFWGSLINNPFHFMERRLAQDLASATDVSGLNYFGDVASTDPFNFRIAYGETNPITWVSSGRDLQIGTEGSEITFTGGQDAILSNSSISSRQQTTHGSSSIQPQRFNQTLLFVSFDRRRVHNFEFNFQQDNYITNHLNIHSDEIISHLDTDGIDGSFEHIQWSEHWQTLFCITSNNALVAFSVDNTTKLAAWHKHTIGGSNAGGAAVKVHSLAIIPASDGELVVLNCEREVNGGSVFYQEKLGLEFKKDTLDFPAFPLAPDPTHLDDAVPWFSDCALAVDNGVAGTAFLGFGHLEGEEVEVLADGFYVGSFTVVGATITLNNPATRIVAGLKYISTVKTMPLEAGGEFGTAQGNVKRIDRGTLKFYRTYGAKYGPDENNLDEINFRPGTLPLGSALPLFTGDQRLFLDSDPDQTAQVVVKQELPMPCNVLSATFRGVSYD